MPETAFLIDDLTDGVRREWLLAGREYTGTVEQRAEIVKAIRTTRWQRADEPMPMSPGLLLQAVIARSGIKLVAQFGYSIHEIRHPDCSCADPCHPDHFASYSLVGMMVRERDVWWTFYLLDIGVGAVPLASDLESAPSADGTTAWCAMEWHDDCKDKARARDDGQPPCTCQCHR